MLAPFLLPRRAATVLLGAGARSCRSLFFIVRLNYALPYYYYAWQPQLVLVCALVLAALVPRAGARASVAAVAIALPLVLAALGTVRDVATTEPRTSPPWPRQFRPGAARRRGRDLGARDGAGS